MKKGWSKTRIWHRNAICCGPLWFTDVPKMLHWSYIMYLSFP